MSRWIIIWRSLKREVCSLNTLFAETLRKLRSERGLSQKQLGEKLFVNHSTVARWENGTRLPDAAMISRLSSCLGVDVNTLLNLEEQSDESPNVILVDDSRAVLSDAVTVLGEVLPNATITGFVWPREAIEYARTNYSLDAWQTEACGFVLKPLTPERIRDQLKKLRYPFSTGGADE